jgi:hypothetical protein
MSLMTFSGHQNYKTLIRCKFSPEYTGFRYIYTGSYCGKGFIYDTKTDSRVAMLESDNYN